MWHSLVMDVHSLMHVGGARWMHECCLSQLLVSHDQLQS